MPYMLVLNNITGITNSFRPYEHITFTMKRLSNLLLNERETLLLSPSRQQNAV